MWNLWEKFTDLTCFPRNARGIPAHSVGVCREKYDDVAGGKVTAIAIHFFKKFEIVYLLEILGENSGNKAINLREQYFVVM